LARSFAASIVFEASLVQANYFGCRFRPGYCYHLFHVEPRVDPIDRYC